MHAHPQNNMHWCAFQQCNGVNHINDVLHAHPQNVIDAILPTTLTYLINEDPRLPFSQIFSTLHAHFAPSSFVKPPTNFLPPGLLCTYYLGKNLQIYTYFG